MNPPARHRLMAILGTAALLTACAAAATDAPSAPASITPRPTRSGSHDATPVDVSKLSGRIVFANSTDDVWSVNADGTDLRQLTRDPAHDFDPTLSPDGKLIAFRSERDGNNEIYVMNADGSSQRNVSRNETDDWGPTWSPDSKVLWNCARESPR